MRTESPAPGRDYLDFGQLSLPPWEITTEMLCFLTPIGTNTSLPPAPWAVPYIPHATQKGLWVAVKLRSWCVADMAQSSAPWPPRWLGP